MSSSKIIPDPKTRSDWEKLPTELWAAIAKRLNSISDYISFRGVCRCWRSAAKFDNFDSAFPRVPWLMYASEKRENKGGIDKEEQRIDVKRVTNFLDMETETSKMSNFPPAAGIPYLTCGGWILYVSNDSVDVILTHPIWRIEIELPGLDTFPPFKREDKNCSIVIRKMVFSGSPAIKTDLVVMVIWGDKKQLAFCRPGDSSWTVMATWDGSFLDIIYHKRRLYAVDSSLRVVECDVHGPNPTQLRQVFVLPDPDHELRGGEVVYYLVESSAKLLIVSRHFILRNMTMGFQIFEFDLMDGRYSEVDDLGNKALFLGCNSSICVELPASSKVKPNRIYYTDNIGHFKCRYSDMGVYKLSTQSIKRFLDGFSGVISPPTTWILPSF